MIVRASLFLLALSLLLFDEAAPLRYVDLPTMHIGSARESYVNVVSSVGLVPGARVALSISSSGDDAAPGSVDGDLRLHVFLLTESQRVHYEELSTSPPSSTTCAPPSSGRAELVGLASGARVDFVVRETDRYSLYIAYCGAAADVSLTVASVAFVNPTGDGGESYTYLPIEQAALPVAWCSFAAAYAALAINYAAEMWQQASSLLPMHLAIAVLLILKVLLCSQTANFYFALSAHGQVSRGLRLSKELLRGYSDWAFLTVLLAIGAPLGPQGPKLRYFLSLVSLCYVTSISVRVICEAGSVTENPCEIANNVEWILKTCTALLIFIILNHGIQNRRNPLAATLPPLSPALALDYVSSFALLALPGACVANHE